MAIELTIDGKVYSELDLTLGDMEELEEMLGVSLGETDITRVKNLTIVVFIFMRSQQPSFTLEDARKVKVGSLMAGGEQSPPDAAAAKPATQARSGRARSGSRS